ncbi:MAG TPA: protein-disulfide reductase DsbD domain-containing protein [Wenzhouxiangellaceae bacterium]|nr:protein-disulfide reductase DsbD domain-containing protein [Wenzhouxiangellaceae bacterium]
MKKTMHLLALIPALLLAPVAGAQINPDDLLPVDQAFAMSTDVGDDGSHVRIEWEIADGYYLYRHAFKFEATAAGAALGEPEIPPGNAYSDEFFGDVEIYRGRASATIPVERRPAAGPLAVRVAYQGCADLGVCYPPQRVELALPLPAGSSASTALPLAEPAAGSGLLDRLDGFGGSRELTGRSDPLPPEQAFRVETIALGPGELLARFTVHPDYYLYRDSIEFEAGAAGVDIAGMTLPEAVAVSDEYFGDTFAYFGEVEIPPAGPAIAVSAAGRSTTISRAIGG